MFNNCPKGMKMVTVMNIPLIITMNTFQTLNIIMDIKLMDIPVSAFTYCHPYSMNIVNTTERK